MIPAKGGVLLGAPLMISLSFSSIAKEHDNLPNPESTTCAEMLDAGEIGGVPTRHVHVAQGVGAIFKFIAFRKDYPSASDRPIVPIPNELGP